MTFRTASDMTALLTRASISHQRVHDVSQEVARNQVFEEAFRSKATAVLFSQERKLSVSQLFKESPTNFIKDQVSLFLFMELLAHLSDNPPKG